MRAIRKLRSKYPHLKIFTMSNTKMKYKEFLDLVKGMWGRPFQQLPRCPKAQRADDAFRTARLQLR